MAVQVPDRPEGKNPAYKSCLFSQRQWQFKWNVLIKGSTNSKVLKYPPMSIFSGQVVRPPPCYTRQLLLWMKSAESEADHCNNKNGTQQMRGIKKEKEKRMMFQAPGKLMLWVNNGNEFFKGKKTFMDNWVITSARFSLCLLPEVKNERKRGLQEGTTNHQSHNSRDTDGSTSGRHLRYLASTSSMSK